MFSFWTFWYIADTKFVTVLATYQIGLLSSLLPVVLLELVSLAQDGVDVKAAVHWTEVHLEIKMLS